MAAREGKVEEEGAGGDGHRTHKRKSHTEVAATEEHVAHCYDAIVAHFKGHAPPKETFDVEGKHPLFVTWKKYDHRKNLTLRGCIGNLSPIPLSKIKEYALTSALRDRRFAPMDPSELPHTHCGVSLLVNYEEGRSWSDFEIGKHGMIIEFGFQDGSEFSATYLPEVAKEQRWNHQETIDSLIRKAGYKGRISGRVREAIRLTRYQSSKAALTYDEWLAMRGYDKPPL